MAPSSPPGGMSLEPSGSAQCSHSVSTSTQQSSRPTIQQEVEAEAGRWKLEKSKAGPGPIPGSIVQMPDAPHTAQMFTGVTAAPNPSRSPQQTPAPVDPAPMQKEPSAFNWIAPFEDDTNLNASIPALGAPPCASSAVPVGTASRWQARKDSWFQFPAEIRNIIYHEILRMPDTWALYQGYSKQREAYYQQERKDPNVKFPHFDGKLSTPSIILVCKRITQECLPILQSQTFVVDRMGPIIPLRHGGDGRPMKVSAFIGRRTLQRLKYIDIRFHLGQGSLGSGWMWGPILLDLLEILLERNAFKTLRVMVKIFNWENHNVWNEERAVYGDIYKQVVNLGNRSPNVWNPGEIIAEHWLFPNIFTAHYLPEVRDLRFHHDLNHTTDELWEYGDKRKEDRHKRLRPDPDFFVSSHADFL